jgi:hypothetical protein
MKTLLPAKIERQTKPSAPQSAAEATVLAACRAANLTERDYVQKACLAGALLLEFRQSTFCENPNVSPGGHRGRLVNRMGHVSAINGNGRAKDGKFDASEDNLCFEEWLTKNGIAPRTARRWMAAAERASHFALKLAIGEDLPLTIDVEGICIPLSQALNTPDAELPDRALKFKQAWFDFMSDRTLSEATRAVVDGESPESRMTRAAAGKTQGGKGSGDRKDFALHAGLKLAECLHHIGAGEGRQGGHWRAMNYADKQLAREHLRLFMRGLPDDLVDFLGDATKQERALRAKGHGAEPLALRAAVSKLFVPDRR